VHSLANVELHPLGKELVRISEHWPHLSVLDSNINLNVLPEVHWCIQNLETLAHTVVDQRTRSFSNLLKL
jgi:hypothetical protein